MRSFVDQGIGTGGGILRQHGDVGKVRIAVFIGEISNYIDEDGVIDVSLYPPGELTRQMCCPWQYDFRDCGCFFWAANKPDLVAGTELDENNNPKHPYLNFQRKDPSYPPKTDIAVYGDERRELRARSRRYDIW